jgi:hypothetical protein
MPHLGFFIPIAPLSSLLHVSDGFGISSTKIVDLAKTCMYCTIYSMV